MGTLGVLAEIYRILHGVVVKTLLLEHRCGNVCLHGLTFRV
jgi:hypothetical protein